MKTVFIVGDASSPLTYERGITVMNLGFKVFWYSICNSQVPGATMLGRNLYQSRFGRFSIVRSAFLIYYYIRFKPDLVHVFYAYHGVINTLTLSIFKNVIITVMGSDILVFNKYHRFKKLVVTILLKRSRIITAKSEFLEKRILEYGCDKNKVFRVNWGIDLDIFRPDLSVGWLRKQYGFDVHDFVLFSHRGCRPIYQNKNIVKGFAKFLSDLNAGTSNYYLIISTMGSAVYRTYYNELVKLVSDLDIKNNVIFTPPIPHADMPYYYCLSNVCISIPYSDGMPQSLFEAMACQCYPLLGNLRQYKEVEESGGYYGKVLEFTQNAINNALLSVLNDPEGVEIKKIKNQTFIKEYANKARETIKLSDLYNCIIRRDRSL